MRPSGVLAAVAATLLAGCGLDVPRFSGTIVEMTLAGATVTPAGHHLEIWARDSNDDVLRIVGANSNGNPPGLLIVPALTFDDPCIIDGAGHLLTSPDAYPGPVTHAGVTQTPDEQAQQVKNRIAQVTGTDIGGKQMSTLLAVIPFHVSPPPTVAPDAAPQDRLTACQQYWQDPLAYTGNPAELEAPLNGIVYGFVKYITTSPPTDYDGLRIECPITLKDAQEYWLTDESVPAVEVDPVHRGPVYLDGKPDHGGNEVLHFDLTGPSASGTAALEVYLDDDTVSF